MGQWIGPHSDFFLAKQGKLFCTCSDPGVFVREFIVELEVLTAEPRRVRSLGCTLPFP